MSRQSWESEHLPDQENAVFFFGAEMLGAKARFKIHVAQKKKKKKKPPSLLPLSGRLGKAAFCFSSSQAEPQGKLGE